MNLESLGWNGFFQAGLTAINNDSLVPARVICEHRDRYDIVGEFGELSATIAGRFRQQSMIDGSYPAVGDWVAVRVTESKDRAVIEQVLPRRSAFNRRAVKAGGMPETGGRTAQQVLASNVDTVFLVSGLDNDFNLRRIERFLSVAWDSGATPVVVLNKADLCENIEACIEQVAEIAVGVDVVSASAEVGTNMSLLDRWVVPGKTVALLGSSGVGKSTIINYLCGENRQEVQGVRRGDQHGRHTTTSRELIVLPSGACLIDTPGLRRVQPWIDQGGLNRTFDEIDSLAQACRFRDCTHQSEPGCAVIEAIENGQLDPDRMENYRRMMREASYLERRTNQKAEQIEKAKWKQITKQIRNHYKFKR